MNIKKTVSEIQSFSGLLPIAERAEVKLSLWGSRHVCVAGYEGTLHIDALASRVMRLLRQVNYEFNETERGPGKRLAARIDQLHAESDRQVMGANLFTQGLVTLRKTITCIFDFFIKCKVISTRFHWGSFGFNDDFGHYTRTQLQTVFGLSPEEAERRNYIVGGHGGENPRWRVREDMLGHLNRSASSV
jgi:hypothetical protein